MNTSKEVHSQPSMVMRALRIREQIERDALSEHRALPMLSFVHLYIRRQQDIPRVASKKEMHPEKLADEIWNKWNDGNWDDCW